uniref:DUF4706 domain-containing protein n=1 Tax=Timema poppense TaxID=170557 RepID=A0A7R9DEP1_TIMPO|nr:unnamed protein product [Timema poppensis]
MLHKDNLAQEAQCLVSNHGFSWHDEHSSPFTWLTQSQLNLNIFKDSEISTKKSRGSLESQEPVVPTKKPPNQGHTKGVCGLPKLPNMTFAVILSLQLSPFVISLIVQLKLGIGWEHIDWPSWVD